MKSIDEMTSTYREITETVRRTIRDCFFCEKKYSSDCQHCPPQRVREDILTLLRYAHDHLIASGYQLPRENDRKLKKIE